MSKEQYIELPEEYTRRGAERPLSGNPIKRHDLTASTQIFQCDGKPLRHHPATQGEGRSFFSLSPKLVTEEEFFPLRKLPVSGVD